MTISNDKRAEVLIVGGGIAGMEALLALQDLAGVRVHVTMISADPEFTYLPELVEEPFTMRPASRTDLALATRELGADFRLGRLSSVDAGEQTVRLEDGAELDYDDLVVCLGGRRRPPYAGVTTLLGPQLSVDVDELLHSCADDEHATLAMIVPPGVTWALPLYEFALMARRRVEELGLSVQLVLYSPEAAPLGLFGVEASAEVAAQLRARNINFVAHTRVRREVSGALVGSPGDRLIEASRIVALPEIAGPAIQGLPADSRGFIPTDAYGRVVGTPWVFAAGDGTTFPIKQGGLACQQADAVASYIAARHGAPVLPEACHPALRGKLLTGADSLYMHNPLTGGSGEGEASDDSLWQPAVKVAGRYLAPWLTHGTLWSACADNGFELATRRDWHEVPMAIDRETFVPLD